MEIGRNSFQIFNLFMEWLVIIVFSIRWAHGYKRVLCNNKLRHLIHKHIKLFDIYSDCSACSSFFMRNSLLLRVICSFWLWRFCLCSRSLFLFFFLICLFCLFRSLCCLLCFTLQVKLGDFFSLNLINLRYVGSCMLQFIKTLTWCNIKAEWQIKLLILNILWAWSVNQNLSQLLNCLENKESSCCFEQTVACYGNCHAVYFKACWNCLVN